MDVKKHRIELINKGITVNCSEDQNVLQALEHQSNSRFMVGCRFGGCGFCRVKVLEGTYTSLPMSESYVPSTDRENNIVLACRIFPTSDMRLHFLGQYGPYEQGANHE